MEEQKKTLEESEQALQKYKEHYDIVQLTPFGGDKEKENIAMQKLGGLTGKARGRAGKKGGSGSPLQGSAGSACKGLESRFDPTDHGQLSHPETQGE